MKQRSKNRNGSPAGTLANGQLAKRNLSNCKDLAYRLYGPPWRPPCAEPDRCLYRQFFDPPALSFETEARRAAERYRAELRQAFGKDVPEKEVDDFEAGFLDGCTRADAGEGYSTGFSAGRRFKQRKKVRERQRADTPSEEPEVFLDAADAMEWYAEGGPNGGGPRPATVPVSSLPPGERPATYERRSSRRGAGR